MHKDSVRVVALPPIPCVMNFPTGPQKCTGCTNSTRAKVYPLSRQPWSAYTLKIGRGFKRHFKKSVQSRAGIEIDYRLLLSDRLIKHIHQVAQPVVNASGDVIEMVGTLMGVTKAKQAEEKIAKSA